MALLACGFAIVAQAQVQRSGGNSDARVLQQMQQLTSEKAALQAENDRLKQQLEQAKGQLQKSASSTKELENRNRALQAAAGRDTASSQQIQEQLERTRAQLQELVAKFRETAQTLREVETDRATIDAKLASRERDYQTCIDRSVGLYELNKEVLDRMENRGFWSQVAQREPFTRMKRTQLENLIDDYRYRVEELRLQNQPQAQSKPAQ